MALVVLLVVKALKNNLFLLLTWFYFHDSAYFQILLMSNSFTAVFSILAGGGVPLYFSDTQFLAAFYQSLEI